MGVSVAGTEVAVTIVGVAVGRRVGKLKTTVAVGSRGGGGVTVGTRVLVGVGGPGVKVGPAVGIKLGKVGVTVGGGGGGGSGVAVGGAARVKGSTNSTTIIAPKTRTTNPANMPRVSACERVKLISLHPIQPHFTSKSRLRKERDVLKEAGSVL